MQTRAQIPDRSCLEGLTDVTLVERVLDGDQALFELLMRRYNRRLFRLARSILKCDGDAEDAVQEAYLKAYLKLDQFRGPYGFGSWLCQIAANEALMRRRRVQSTLVPLSTLDQATHREAAMTHSNANDITPDGAVYDAQLRQLLEGAIDALPDIYRTAFVLREVEQFSVAEAAACLGIEPATVKTRVHRARKLVQRTLSAELSAVLADAYAFDGARCDRLVERVFKRIAGLSHSAHLA